MRSTRRGVWTWLLGVICALVAGFAAGAAQREAHAQSIATSTIVVPAGAGF